MMHSWDAKCAFSETDHLLGITGHIRSHITNEVRDALSDALDGLKEKHGNRLMMLNSLADGADLLAVQLAMQKNIRLAAVLPKEAEVYAGEHAAKNHALYQQALGYACAAFSLESEHPYYAASRYIAEACHTLFALWDGEKTKFDLVRGNNVGGTYHTLEMARACGKEIFIIAVTRET